MSLHHVEGDLFALDLPAIGHGCNCRGSMSGGVARDVRDRWPALHAEYQRRCAAAEFRLGDAWAWTAPDGQVVFNLATQDLPGPHADLAAIGAAVGAMLADAERRGLPAVGLPRLGAGIGGLEWRDVEQVLTPLAEDSPVGLTVVTRPARRRR